MKIKKRLGFEYEEKEINLLENEDVVGIIKKLIELKEKGLPGDDIDN